MLRPLDWHFFPISFHKLVSIFHDKAVKWAFFCHLVDYYFSRHNKLAIIYLPFGLFLSSAFFPSLLPYTYETYHHHLWSKLVLGMHSPRVTIILLTFFFSWVNEGSKQCCWVPSTYVDRPALSSLFHFYRLQIPMISTSDLIPLLCPGSERPFIYQSL